jgi:hypothetical protein
MMMARVGSALEYIQSEVTEVTWTKNASDTVKEREQKIA